MAKKKGLKVLLICSSVFVGILVLDLSYFFIADYIGTQKDRNSLYFVDIYNYYLPPIQGSPSKTSKEEYQSCFEAVAEDIANPIMPFFPQEIPYETADFFFYIDTIKPTHNYHDRWEIYLSCKWNNLEYVNEVDRLKNEYCSLTNEKAFYSQNLFLFPSSVMAYNFFTIFQYALFDNENLVIHYISLCEIESIDNVVFDKAFAPQKTINEADISAATRSGSFYIYQ